MRSILIVDDNEDNLFLFQEYLEDNGFVAIMSSSGQQALQVLKQKSVDAVVLDIQMPEMDGFELCRRIKSDPQTKHLPIIFVTAKFQDVDSVATGLYLGAQDYLYKPVEEKDLIERLLLILGHDNEDAASQLPSPGNMLSLLTYTLQRIHGAGNPCAVVGVKIVGEAPDAESLQKALASVAKTCVSSVRKLDIVGQQSDTQLLLILPACRHDLAVATASRLRAEIVSAHSNLDWQFAVSVAALDITPLFKLSGGEVLTLLNQKLSSSET